MQCTAKAKRTGCRCKAWSIRGKDKCKVHGGLTPIKSGRYSKYNAASVQMLSRARILKNIDGVYDELAATMTCLREYMKNPENRQDAKVLLALWEKLYKLVYDLMKNEMSCTNVLQNFIEHIAGRLSGAERMSFLELTAVYISGRK